MPPRNIASSLNTMPNGQQKKIYEPLAHRFVEESYDKLLNYTSYIVKPTFPNREDRILDITHEVVQSILEGRYSIQFDKAPLTYCQGLLRNAHNRMGNLKRDSPIGGLASLDQMKDGVLSQDDSLDDLE